MEKEAKYSLQELAQMHAKRHRESADKYRAFVEKISDMDKEYFLDDNNLPCINYIGTPSLSRVPFYGDGFKLPENIGEFAQEIIYENSMFYTKAIYEAMPELEGKFHSWFHFHNEFCWPHPKKDYYTAPNGTQITENEFYDRHIDQAYKNRDQYAPIMMKAAELMDQIASFLEGIK
jgi:hypothetical protein